jgi:hypothetical protein
MEFMVAMASIVGVLLVFLMLPGDPVAVYASSQNLALAAYLIHSAPGQETPVIMREAETAALPTTRSSHWH